MNNAINSVADRNTTVFIHKSSYGKLWSCAIERETDGVKLKVEKTGDSIEEVIEDALTAFSRIASPIKEFSGALLEHQPSAKPTGFELDDDIPF
jgi:hypothetical protein